MKAKSKKGVRPTMAALKRQLENARHLADVRGQALNKLQATVANLQSALDGLQAKHNALTGIYRNLQAEHEALRGAYNELGRTSLEGRITRLETQLRKLRGHP